MDDPQALSLLAYFFSLLLMMHSADHEVPVLIGPYDDWSTCASVREYLDRRGYETDMCALLARETPSIRLNVIDIPKGTN